MSVRKRSGSGGKRALKEKVVEVYEGLFRGEQVAVGNSNYWEEFFLLKPKMAVLEVRPLQGIYVHMIITYDMCHIL